jgi:hypothetical protein
MAACVFVRTIATVLAPIATVSACGATVAGRPPLSGESTVRQGPTGDEPGVTAPVGNAEHRTAQLELAGPRVRDPSVNIQDLTDAEKGELCDHWVAIFGGYGTTYPCESGHMEGPLDRAESASSSFPSACAATVGQVERCMSALMPSRGCVLRQGAPPPECAPLLDSCSYRRPARVP